jgi:nucleoid-associated protein YgaU
MNTKVKVGIAAAIVAALVALIVLDQKTAPSGAGPTPPSGSPDAGGVTLTSPPGGSDPVRVLRDEQVQDLIKKAREQFTNSPSGPLRPLEPQPVQPQPVNPVPAEPRGNPRGDEYAVLPGDTLGTIAQAKYGSTRFQNLILDANPGLKPNALRVGEKIVLPVRADRVEKAPDEAVGKSVPADPAPAVGADRVYVVVQGDTLSQISTKVYKTSRYVNQILEANRGVLADPHFLTVGMKLTMPDLAVRNAAASPATAATSAPSASGKVHTVSGGDSLWRIAERYASGKGVGVLEMIQLLVQSNPDKLKDDKTMLRLGWQLIVPE